MPIFDQGYQHWKGELSGHAWRWWTVTRQGMRVGLRSIWVRLLILVAWFPALALATLLVLWGLFEQKAAVIMPLVRLLRLPEVLQAGPQEFRNTVWTLAFYYFFEIEMFFIMLIVLVVGPGLISRDLRFNAMPLYFSRPLRRVDYFVGKLGVIAAIVCLVALVPALLAYILGMAFSLDFTIIRDTYHILLASLGYGALVTLSTGLLMLAFSSLSRNSRYVMAFWLGFWILTSVSSGIVHGIIQVQYQQERNRVWMAQRQPNGRLPFPPPVIERPLDWSRTLSYTGNLNAMSHLLLNTDKAWNQILSFANPHEKDEMRTALAGPEYPWYWTAGILAGLGFLSAGILGSRVKSLDRLR